MTHILLLGAGFSRNWGGWLASEAFEYLLGSPEVLRDPQLRALLWKHQNTGGFENALAELQQGFSRGDSIASSKLTQFQNAVGRMFGDMNKGFLEIVQWEFGNDLSRLVRTFLSRFDAIFTLNQDIMLEQHYLTGNVALSPARKWDGPQFPGMRRLPVDDPMSHNSWARSTWHPLPDNQFVVLPRSQPVFKLHGSSNWLRADGSALFIMGGAKSASIKENAILAWYARLFDEHLSRTDSRLMAIGYGFGDEHINDAIKAAVKTGLKLFIIDPNGSEVAQKLNDTRKRGQIICETDLERMLQDALIGASRRGLRETFGNDTVEYNKVMQFFRN